MEQEVLAILSQVIHPAKDADILNLGMVEDVRVEDGKIKFRLVSSSPDPLMGSIKKQCEALLKETFPFEQDKDLWSLSGRYVDPFCRYCGGSFRTFCKC